MMDFYLRSFESNREVFRTLLENLSETEYRWREAADKWNILEIVCHLYDEEQEDFRKRLVSVLEDPNKPFESIDPVGWVKMREYDKQNFSEKLKMFLEERKNSIEWMKTLQNAAWENVYHHPQIGPMSAKYIIANWLAHDSLHIRQITRIKYRYLEKLSGQNLNYAGNW